jgi:hypothetical protein
MGFEMPKKTKPTLPFRKTYDRYFEKKNIRELSRIASAVYPGQGLSVEVLGAVLLHILKKMDIFTEVSFIFPLTPPSLESEMTYEKAKKFFKSHPNAAGAFQEELHEAEKGFTIQDRKRARTEVASLACPLMLAFGDGLQDPIAECFFSRAIKTKNYWAIVKNYPAYKEFQYRLGQATRLLNSAQFLASFFEESNRTAVRGLTRKVILETFRSYVLERFGRLRLRGMERLQSRIGKLF